MGPQKRELPKDYEHVDHPKHYAGKIECIDYIQDKLTKEEYIGFLKGSIIKYLDRLGKKEDDYADCKKAMWYLERLTALYVRPYEVTLDGNHFSIKSPTPGAPSIECDMGKVTFRE